ncbi:hypothetical protein EPUL_005001, partial [Erysiphe pulchra]
HNAYLLLVPACVYDKVDVRHDGRPPPQSPPPPCHQQPKFETDHQKQARISVQEVMVDYPPDLDSQTSYFTTEGFTSHSPQDTQQSDVTMENIHKMMPELYKAIIEKTVMENAALCAALKAENKAVKRELEDFKKGSEHIPDKPVPKEQQRSAQPATENQVAGENQDLGKHQSKTPEHALPAHPRRYLSS